MTEVKGTNQNISKIPITDMLAKGFSIYSKTVIQERALPDLRDGLKPVQRRILYSMYANGQLHSKPTVKSAKIVGNVMGTLHPHSDCLSGDTEIRLLSGEMVTIGELTKRQKEAWVLGIDQKTGKIIPVLAHSFRIGQYTTKKYHIKFTNGYEVVTTSNHPFRLLNGNWVKAEDIKKHMVFDFADIDLEKKYIKVSGQNTKKTRLHQLVFNAFNPPVAPGDVVHHIDENKRNNNPDNLKMLSRGEHALLHHNYTLGLSAGRKSMFGPNSTIRESVREKNSTLARQLNKNAALVKANHALSLLDERGLDLTEDNYETLRSEVYNLPIIANMVKRGKIKSFDDLIDLHCKGIKFIDYTPMHEDKKETHTVTHQHTFNKRSLSMLVPYLQKVPVGESDLPRFDEYKNSMYRRTLVDHFDNQKEFEEILAQVTPIVSEVTVEEVEEPEPMYDFTVDDHHNMLICANEDGSLLVDVHNSAIYGTMVNMSRPWTMSEPLVDMQGNNGSIDGDAFAAMRYTESRLSQLTEDTFMANLNKEGVVKFIPNFDDTTVEPSVLPVQFPNILVNGGSGIASGYATSMAPHNLTEVLKASKLVLLNESVTIDDVLNVMPAPDFPTGGTIIGAHNMKSVYNSGKGKITIRSVHHLEKGANKSKQNIIIDEIPYDVNKADLVGKLKDIVLSKKVGDLLDIEDESDRSHEVRIRITVKVDADIDAILGYLYKKTDLQHNFNLNNVVIDEGHPRQLGVIPILKKFNKFRLETLVRGFQSDLDAINARRPIVEGYIKFANNLDKYLTLIKQSTSRQDAIDKLVAEDFLKVQAENIVSMAVYRLANVSLDKYRKEEQDLNTHAKAINKLLADPKLQVQAVSKTYDNLIEKYARKRKTHVLQDDHQLAVAKVDVIPEEDVVISISRQGYIKRSSVRSYQSTDAGLIPLQRGDELLEPQLVVTDTLGEPEEVVNADDVVDTANVSEPEVVRDAGFEATTKQYLLLFTNKLRYMYIPIYKIKDAKWKDLGQHLSQYGADLKDGELIVSGYVMTGDAKQDDEYNVLQVRSNGNVKLTPMSAYVKGSNYFKLSDLTNELDVTLLNTWLTKGTDGWLGLKDSIGRVMYFPLEEVSVTNGVKAKGMKGLGLNKGDTAIEADYAIDEQLIIDKYQYFKGRGRKGFKFKANFHPTVETVHESD